MTHEPLVVIGMGADGPATLSREALEHIRRTKVLAGGKRHLGFFPDFAGERIVIEADLDRVICQIRASYQRQKTIVLASGDPLFYGIGRRLLAELPKEHLLFLPQVSSIQLAFARLKVSWDDACVVSVHGRPIERLLAALAQHQLKIAVLTDQKNNPAAIASLLEEHGRRGEYDIWVCENLGGPEERVYRWTSGTEASDLNVVVLLRKSMAMEADRIPLLGIPEQELQHRPSEDGLSEGLITRREPRLIALSRLELHADDVLWDIGAGSGSVGIEAARLSAQLTIFAVEREPQAVRDIQGNVGRFGLLNIHVVAGEAPDALTDLPEPDCVFIGGSGGRLAEILECVTRRLKPGGRVVLNCVTLETFTRAWTWLGEHGLNPQVTSVQLAHGRPLGSLHCLEPDKPLFILRAHKK